MFDRGGGTRTNALVAAGAAAFVMSCGISHWRRSVGTRTHCFLGCLASWFPGAGVIFKDGANVRGLNTAATVWCSASIGALCGLGALNLALVLAATVLFTNMVLRKQSDSYSS
ncbi:MAG: MgtC/SapB family protein [Terracidiphilus sp.]|jgi:putative Mg2+ transporter-C (MgtC) family protein